MGSEVIVALVFTALIVVFVVWVRMHSQPETGVEDQSKKSKDDTRDRP